MSYPDAVNLPFNGKVVQDEYKPRGPEDEDPNETGYYAILQGGSLVVKAVGGEFLLPQDLPTGWLSPDSHPIYIGTWRGKPLRAFRLGHDTTLVSPYVAEPFNAIVELLDDQLLTLGGLAHQILHWDSLSRLCARCGVNTVRMHGSWGKRCPACGHEQYPAIHPCVIVLIRRGNSFLLARKESWPKGRYGLVAGFLDFGESLEECVAREVREETGIEVKSIQYVGSQNWPFPSQLMAGFIAEYAGGEIVVDRTELEDARWFSVEDMPTMLPPRRSIARWIIDHYAFAMEGTSR